MIPCNWIYFRPDTLAEAVDVYAQFRARGKAAFYYAGGSEIITVCRGGGIRPDAVIDIKRIPACGALSLDEQALHIGSACTLSQIGESGLFPLLRLSCGRIADHTNQCRITLGGNLCGSIIYRETSLPLLLSDAEVTLVGPEGERVVAFQGVFDGRMRLRPGELLVQAHVPAWALCARHFHIKRTTNEKIDYPLVAVAALCKNDRLRVGFSGVCAYPFRSEAIESVLNERAKSVAERAALAAELLPEAAHTDVEGSGQYRMFVLQHTLRRLLEEWEHGTV